MTRNSAILILAYQRPDFLLERLKEVETLRDKAVFVSVDFSVENSQDLAKRFQELKFSFPIYRWIFRETNLGLARHIHTAISEVLQEYENCIVIEDDVAANPLGIKSLSEILEERLPPDILTVGLFGGLPSFKVLELLCQNRWRKTRYFSAWCWGIQREDWVGFSLEFVRDLPVPLQEILETEVGRRRKAVWSSRLGKVVLNPEFTWDYQMFFYGIIKGKKHLLPVTRAADNLGLGDTRATNTKHKRPTWYIGKSSNSYINPRQQLRSRVGTIILQRIDSFTWASDSPFLLKLKRLRKLFKTITP